MYLITLVPYKKPATILHLNSVRQTTQVTCSISLLTILFALLPVPILFQESIRFSLERNTVCPETALAFALYSSSLIQHEQDFAEAKRV